MLIHLLRHGIAEDHHPDGDDGRRLTAEGTERLRRAAGGWCRLLRAPDEIWVSPLRRARQTAAVFAEAVRFRGEVQTVDGLRPEDDMLTIVQRLEQAQLDATKAVALVGHEPHLGTLLGHLLHGRPGMAIPLRKGMLATVQTQATTSVHSRLRLLVGQRTAARCVGDDR